jgi:hypothetical protein
VAEEEEATRQSSSIIVHLRALGGAGRRAVGAVQLLLVLDRGRLGYGLLIIDTRVGAGLSGR